MPDLLNQTQAQRMQIYIGESDRWRGGPLYAALLEALRSHGMAGATVMRGAAGFGAHSTIYSASIEELSSDLPILIDVVDTPEKIAAVIEVITPMVREGLITVEDVQIVRHTHRYLNPLPADRLVSEVMSKNVVTLSPYLTVHEAWKLMLENRLKAMPVVDKDGKVAGILTDEDLLERAGIQERLSVAVRMEPAEINQQLRTLENSPLKVAAVMTRPVITAQQTETLGAVTARMVKAGLKRVPVVDEKEKLVGMLSRLDILHLVANTPVEALPPQSPLGAVRTVREIMSSTIPMVNQDDNLVQVVERFAQANTHRLIVVDDHGKAVGLISDSDVVSRIQPAHRNSILNALRRIGIPPAGKETAYDLMSHGPLTVPPDLPVVEAIRRMMAEGRKWMVVADAGGRALGLVDRQILLQALSEPAAQAPSAENG